MSKNDPGRTASYVAAGFAVLSLGMAFGIRFLWPDLRESVGYVILGAWVIGPPVWFWTEWVFLSDGQNPERLKHTHDLARNIWLALVVVLAVILGVKWPLG
jgi:hypothetical protein